MRKMLLPQHDPVDVFRMCVDMAGTEIAKQRYNAHVLEYTRGSADYAQHSAAKSWYSLPRSLRGNPEQIVAGTLTKREAVALYDDCMVATRGQSRDIYDALKVAAGGKCPFCGGIGQVSTLDHYLPKSYFPLHAVNPHNLVPSCKDCNTDKNSAFASNPSGQGLHPYLDEIHFFNERWVFATVSEEMPVSVQFSAVPPDSWTQVDKERAINHFTDNNLPLRYATECGGQLSLLIEWRKGSLRRFTPEEFSEHLFEGANNLQLLLNGWERTMYLALANSIWFCSQNF